MHNAFGGSGDPEVNDQTHISTFLENEFKDPSTLSVALKGFSMRLEALDSTWSARRPEFVNTVPLYPEENDPTAEFFAAPWQIGYDDAAAMKVGLLQDCFQLWASCSDL